MIDWRNTLAASCARRCTTIQLRPSSNTKGNNVSNFPMPYVSTDLTDQVAFVTGTTSGLGRRFAKVLAACGAKVAATGRRVERLEALAEEIRAEGGVCEPIAIDMTQGTVFEAPSVKHERNSERFKSLSIMLASLTRSEPSKCLTN